MIVKANKKGFSLVELLLAIGIFAILVSSLTIFSLDSYRASYNSQRRIEAALLIQEISNTILTIKNNSWRDLIINADGQARKIVYENGNYSLQSGADSRNGFNISITINVVNRDASGNIVESGGNQDARSRDVNISISWLDNFNRLQSINSSLYVNDWNTLLWRQTSLADFNAGSFDYTATRNNQGGEVQLDIVAYPDWCRPTLAFSSLNLPGSAISTSITAIQGEAFVGTGSTSTSINFMDINISNSQPPVASVLSTYTGNKANSVFGEDDYVYIATDSDTKEVIIFDITGQLPVEVGSFNSPGTANGRSVYVVGNKGYLTTSDSQFYIFDVTAKTGVRNMLGEKTLMGEGTEVQVNGNFAYISLTNGAHVELQVINISNPADLVTVGVGNTSQSDASDLFINPEGTRAYVGTASSAEKEFIIFDTSTKPQSQNLEYFQESNGIVSIEAENYHSNISRGGKSWTVQTGGSPSGASNNQFVVAGPDTGTSISSNYFNTSPELGYRVNFTNTGTYYFWVRGYATNSSSNNVHGGYDGANFPNVESLSTTSYNSWRWFRGSIDLRTAEMHWLNIWMQDDGFRLDKIYLTRDANFTPSGVGSAESTRVTSSIIMPEINRQVSQFETNGMSIRGVTAVENNTRAILVGTGGQEYQVLDLTDEVSPSKCGGLELNSGIASIASVKESDNDSYSYIITLEANSEFRIIRGGAGTGGSEGEGAIYATEGNFTSSIFDTGVTANSFYNILATASVPQNTTVTLKLRTSNSLAEISGLPFLGPDGTENTSYTINQSQNTSSVLNNRRYIQYRVYLTSNQEATPILDKVEISYQK